MERKTGVVVPLAALYTKDCPDIGDFYALRDFADFCAKSNLSVLQLLPVNDTASQSSPYSALSSCALHPVYIRINAITGFDDAMQNNRTFSAAYKAYVKKAKYSPRFDYEHVCAEKIRLLHLLYDHLEKKMASKHGARSGSTPTVRVVTSDSPAAISHEFNVEVEEFVAKNHWVIPYAVFKNLKDVYSQAHWKEWDEDKARMNRHQIELRWNNRALRSSHNFYVWCQMIASKQFLEAASYVKEKGIILKGDIPILMNEDSVDCWAWPEFFDSDYIAGSPPDGDNPTGQRWGLPIYNWDRISSDSFSWWKERISVASKFYDAYRLDHVLGFFRIWAVNKNETTAYLGYAHPCCTIKKKILEEAGFDDARIKWLSWPHIPTQVIGDITGSWDYARELLGKVCDRIGDEELWTFRKEIQFDSQIYSTAFSDDLELNKKIQDALAKKWLDRTLIEIKKNTFIPVWSYSDSTAWKSLSDQEKDSLLEVFEKLELKENELWKNHAHGVLGPIVSSSEMQPCAEDLGIHLPIMTEVLQALDIASLRVIRWTRDWQNQPWPYEDFSSYPELSVATVSVHDSSTIRQWWQDEKDSVREFIKMAGGEISEEAPFTPELCGYILKSGSRAKSAWYVNPIQDYLYLDQKYYAEDASQERINIPGTVNDWNWTYRMPDKVEDLIQNEELINKIKEIADIHAAVN